MPIYMDMHLVPGVKAREAAEAHRLDLLIEEEHGCKCMTYWIDEARGNVFCLIDAPDKETVAIMHSKAHGLVPHRIIEVETSIVQSFLGRVSDPENFEMNKGVKVFHDPSFRFLLMTKIKDPVLLLVEHGKSRIAELMNLYRETILSQTRKHSGSEAHAAVGFYVASFTSLRDAMNAADEIYKSVSEKLATAEVKIIISGGEPVSETEHLFGDAIQLAKQVFFLVKSGSPVFTSVIKQRFSNDFDKPSENFRMLTERDENFLSGLFLTLEMNCQHSSFLLENYCRELAISKSQLYRKTLALSGYSPNQLLQYFRLQQACEMLAGNKQNISEVSFESGFSSPSYFTKCFKKNFGILPMAYMEAACK